ncbi:hypothetical protein ATW69_09690 [Oenococcus oeni]|nr:hypothetical protein ATX30_09480 [Oenococcus oeni]OIM47694.1 hypothetical protein ATX76_07505 [Oenococcus oeni]OLQ32722.1 hypothetical protein ATW69_09690 [Oenococcus oeni]
MLKNPIFPTTIDGVSIVSSIYYVPGIGGTGDQSALIGHYFVRASGTMGSGLGLGVLCLICLSLCYNIKKKRLRIFIETLFCITIVLTLTGAIIIGLVFYWILKFFMSKKIKYNSIIFVLFWFLGLMSQFIIDLTPQSVLSLFPTVLSRLNGIKYYSSLLRFDFLTILFGSNFNNRWASLANQVYDLNNRFVVDNFFVYNFFSIGLIGTALIAISQFISTRRVVRPSTINVNLVAVNFSFLAMGFANNITYAIGIGGIICFFMIGEYNIQGRSQRRYL